MPKKFCFILVCVAIAGLSFIAGRVSSWWGEVKADEEQRKQEAALCHERANLDVVALQKLPHHASTMKSGAYQMQIWFPDLKFDAGEFNLLCENGVITVTAPNTFFRDQQARTISTNGYILSWVEEGAGYELNARCVGIVDGDEAWGRIYGWNPGKQSVGWWWIYPKTARESAVIK